MKPRSPDKICQTKPLQNSEHPWQTPSVCVPKLKATSLQVPDGSFSTLEEFVSNPNKLINHYMKSLLLREQLTSFLLTVHKLDGL